MLKQLISEGFIPEIIITEDSVIADEEREKFLKRIEGNRIQSLERRIFQTDRFANTHQKKRQPAPFTLAIHAHFQGR